MVQLYSNGDCLYATAVARQIKNDYPGCHLTWAIASFCKNIILNNPYADAVMEINDVAKNDAAALRRLKKSLQAKTAAGEYEQLFFIHNGDTNQAYYDGSIRSSILRAYRKPITVPLTPVLRLTETERNNAANFAINHDLRKYQHVILFEYAPQSGQSEMTAAHAVDIATSIAATNNAAVILSSANKVNSELPAVIDGSSLSLRETAALTQHCTFLLGSSSGITWISTADEAKQLPMVQLLNPDSVWSNPLSRDFERFHFSTDRLIEITDYGKDNVVSCVNLALVDFTAAKHQFNQQVPMHFRSTKTLCTTCFVMLNLQPSSHTLK
ncbi:MAG: hypothetical protein IPP72_17670 [Chitinophagaceae bacterium]|nr:hypothetical protein [Chitinophagaceae bacterium]